MARRIILFSLFFLTVSFIAGVSFATEVTIAEYPKTVSPGQTLNLKVIWKDFPADAGKDYVLRVQLEDQEATPPTFIFKDIDISKQEGQIEVTLSVPTTVTESEAAKYIAAFISRTKNWDDVLASSESEQNVEIISKFKFQIVEYPTVISKGSTVSVKVSWSGVTAGKDYKLIVQLENWDIKPGFAYVSRVDDFKPNGEVVVNIRIPTNVVLTKNCRFVAAFISKAKNWNDVYAVVSTQKDVEIIKYKLI